MAAVFHLVIWGVSLFCAGLYSQDVIACETLNELYHQRGEMGRFSPKNGLQRPEVQNYLDSEMYPIRVHGSAAMASARLERVMDGLEGAWERQVIQMGFDAPLSDGDAGGNAFYDVYLTSVFNQSAVTVAEPSAETLDGTGVSSFILIDTQTPEEEELLVIEHEFQHALQFVMDPLASFFLFEASAVYMETYAFPENLKYEEVLKDYQDWPNAPFFTDGVQWQEQTGVISYFEYGGVLFLMYLEETYGLDDGSFIAELWRLGKNVGSIQNEPDFIDVLGEQDLVPGSLLLDFSVWRTLVNVWAQPEVGPHKGAIWSGDSNMARFTLTPTGLGHRMSFSLKEQLYHAGCLAFDYFSNDQETTLFLDLSMENDEGLGAEILGFSAAFFDADEKLVASWQKLPQEMYWPFELPIPYNQYVIFSLCDVSGQWDTEDGLMPLGIQLYIGDNLPLSSLDGGISQQDDEVVSLPDTTDETGCNCSSQASATKGLTMLWLLMCLGLRRRL